jgi:hypothetical protein
MMNDETEQFEQRMKQQSFRKIPGEWRGEILVAADVNRRKAVRAFTSAATTGSRLREIFWPHPKAWAALATIWIFIFALNFSIRDKSPVVAEKVLPPSPEVVAELRQQKLLFAQLIGSSDVREAEPPKYFPRPRTERVEILTA